MSFVLLLPALQHIDNSNTQTIKMIALLSLGFYQALDHILNVLSLPRTSRPYTGTDPGGYATSTGTSVKLGHAWWYVVLCQAQRNCRGRGHGLGHSHRDCLWFCDC
jgi:hypothetical protein